MDDKALRCDGVTPRTVHENSMFDFERYNYFKSVFPSALTLRLMLGCSFAVKSDCILKYHCVIIGVGNYFIFY